VGVILLNFVFSHLSFSTQNVQAAARFRQQQMMNQMTHHQMSYPNMMPGMMPPMPGMPPTMMPYGMQPMAPVPQDFEMEVIISLFFSRRELVIFGYFVC
jgi:hypothetical protein